MLNYHILKKLGYDVAISNFNFILQFHKNKFLHLMKSSSSISWAMRELSCNRACLPAYNDAITYELNFIYFYREIYRNFYEFFKLYIYKEAKAFLIA